MLILPLPERPNWSRPPVVTLVIIVLCVAVFLLQGRDDEKLGEALRFYQESSLPGTELVAYRESLAQQGKGRQADKLGQAVKGGRIMGPLGGMEADLPFMARLRAGQIIRPDDPAYPRWQEDRRQYERLRARVVTERFALKPHQPQVANLLTHMFLHGDFMHLLGNMAILFLVGYTVEAALGSLGFLGLYLLGGVAAALPDFLGTPQYAFSIGASGAIAAVMAAYVVLFGLRRINFFYWLFVYFGTARWPAVVILPIWLAKELIFRFVVDQHGHTNYLAHFAGLLAGALMAGLYRLRRQGRTARVVEEADARAEDDSLRRHAEEAVARLQFAQAAQLYKRLVGRQGKDAQLLEEYFRVARLATQPDLVGDALCQLLALAGRHPEAFQGEVLAEALTLADELGAHGGAIRTSTTSPLHLPRFSPRAQARIAKRLGETGQMAMAEDMALRLAVRPDAGEVAPALLNQLALLCQHNGDKERMERFARLLRLRYPPEWHLSPATSKL